MPPCVSHIIKRHAWPLDRQSKRRRRGHIRRRLDLKEPPNNQIGQLIVFRPANAVNELVGHQQAKEHRERQRAWRKTKVVLLQEIEEICRNGSAPIVVVDAALLVESGFHREFDRLVVVSSSTENQLQRLVQRDTLTREEALARIAAQWPTEAKVAIADYRLSNDGDLEELRAQARRVYSALLEDLKRKTQEQAR